MGARYGQCQVGVRLLWNLEYREHLGNGYKTFLRKTGCEYRPGARAEEDGKLRRREITRPRRGRQRAPGEIRSIQGTLMLSEHGHTGSLTDAPFHFRVLPFPFCVPVSLPSSKLGSVLGARQADGLPDFARAPGITRLCPSGTYGCLFCGVPCSPEDILGHCYLRM